MTVMIYKGAAGTGKELSDCPGAALQSAEKAESNPSPRGSQAYATTSVQAP